MKMSFSLDFSRHLYSGVSHSCCGRVKREDCLKMKLEGKTAIVTGAGAGIGESTAILFAQNGANVVCTDIADSGLRVASTIQSMGQEAIFVKGDVSEVDSTEQIVSEAITKYDQLDILVNNAGIVIPGRVDNTNPEDWDRTMAVNVRGVYLLSRLAIPHLRKTEGVIINVASAVALMGAKDRAAYTASKGALVSLTRAMAVDYMEDKIRVNCICPGTTETPSLKDRLAKLPDPEAARKQFIERQPLRRFGRPEEIAEGILYLSTAEFCTGTCLSVDGGMAI
ncbi:MAG: 4-formylbenzenesulfonate dehydrogenase TsaC1/TsaC2 [Candidatus Thorarchaeota archaeon AB_25]|nr:MAG: 4-formylbenzenesulfonate dehydrogenase TsaC1/TsaC2 [Candidatus Thorarchaeota archaeon AB_25]